MFQKLYRHLEEISHAARRQEERSATSEEWGAIICGQLESIKQVLEKKEKPASLRPVAVLGGVVAVVLIGLLVVLFVSMKNTRGSAQEALARSSDNVHASMALFTQLQTANGRTQDLEAQVSRLDSIVQLQAQTIVELKKLNKAATQNFWHIHRDLEQMKDGSVSAK